MKSANGRPQQLFRSSDRKLSRPGKSARMGRQAPAATLLKEPTVQYSTLSQLAGRAAHAQTDTRTQGERIKRCGVTSTI
jgi:hypothetical protein